MRDKSPNQIIRFDGKNVFFEVMSNTFAIEKVQINFIEYDPKANNKQIRNLPLYIDIPKFLSLVEDYRNGTLRKLAQESLADAKEKKSNYAREIWVDLGGVSADKLKQRGKERPDGKSLSRQFKITPGNRFPWILSGEYGPGEENDTKLIVPKGRSEQVVRVPLEDDHFKQFLITTEAHIHGFLSAHYSMSNIKGILGEDDKLSADQKATKEAMKQMIGSSFNGSISGDMLKDIMKQAMRELKSEANAQKSNAQKAS